jgi:hypothetical protein
MINGADLAQINKSAASIIDIFEREARLAMQLKTVNLEK